MFKSNLKTHFFRIFLADLTIIKTDLSACHLSLKIECNEM